MKRLDLEITEEIYKNAIESDSGACLVADAIKKQYPELSSISVDVATIRVSNRKEGKRYIFVTPPTVVDVLLSFDQGLKEQELPKKLTIRRPLRISPIVRQASRIKSRAEHRAKRIAELKEKQERGEELTSDEKRSLILMENYKPGPVRPTTYGPTTTESESGYPVLIGGRSDPKTSGKLGDYKKNPNLLPSRFRHFGAKSAKPGFMVQQMIDQAVKQDRAKRRKKTDA